MEPLTAAPEWITQYPIAHRGFHDLEKDRAENSLSAFRAAIEHGFSIECDIQSTKDLNPVVFHDPVLGRMTGEDGWVRDTPSSVLASYRLGNTKDTVQTLAVHLELVAGRVPVVLELKGEEVVEDGFVASVANVLNTYDGPACVMSFDHEICSQFAALMPNIPRGLTAEGDNSKFDTHMGAMHAFGLQFVSYDIRNLDCRFAQQMRQDGLPVITWTVRTVEDRAKAALYADQITFEGYNPIHPGSA